MIRNCPECNCEILYKKTKSYKRAETNKSLCRRCNFRKLARDPERNRKVSEARKKWWEERKTNQEAYETIRKKLGKNNSSMWSNEAEKEAWIAKRWSEENKKLMSASTKERWDAMSHEEYEKIKANMIQARVSAGTVGKNNRKKSGEFQGVKYESSTEERFLKSHILNLGLRGASPIVTDLFVYKPDFWSEVLMCNVELKSMWTFDVMRGLKKYNSKQERRETQLQKIVSLCSEHAIVICVEVGREFYVFDPVNVTEFTDVVKDGKLLSFGFNNDVDV
jgi:hypothetical protein